MGCAVAETGNLVCLSLLQDSICFSFGKKNQKQNKTNVEVSGHVTLTDEQVFVGYSCTLKFCTECLIGIL